MKNLTFGGLKPPRRRAGGPDLKNSKKVSYRTVVRTHTQNFSTVSELESVKKTGELKCEERKERRKDILDPILAILKVP